MRIEAGFRPAHKAQVARLFWQAFQGKLAGVLGPTPRALTFLEATLTPEHAICALDDSGGLLGVVGFKTAQGGLVDAAWSDMRHHYGLLGGIWRSLLLNTLERPLAEGQLLMDGIFVDARARGQGVGRALLDAVCQTAQARGCAEVRLDVIDTNPRARALYEREGFMAQGQEHTGPLRPVFGFSSATRMVKRLD